MVESIYTNQNPNFMEAIDLVMKIFGIRDIHRAEIEDLLRNTPEKYLGLSLAQYAQHPHDTDYDPAVEAWMDEYLPEITFR